MMKSERKIGKIKILALVIFSMFAGIESLYAQTTGIDSVVVKQGLFVDPAVTDVENKFRKYVRVEFEVPYPDSIQTVTLSFGTTNTGKELYTKTHLMVNTGSGYLFSGLKDISPVRDNKASIMILLENNHYLAKYLNIEVIHKNPSASQSIVKDIVLQK